MKKLIALLVLLFSFFGNAQILDPVKWNTKIVQKSNTEEVTIETTKAEGDKCPICWKISNEKCKRHSN